MIPMHRYMDMGSHPFQISHQMTSGSYLYPCMETVPSYMMMDPATPCMPLHGSGCNCFHYAYPMPSYSCFNGANFFQPLHLPVPPHQHTHCYGGGGFPPYSESYMAYMFPFPPHYNVEQQQQQQQPRYEFADKNMRRNHNCCCCPNSLDRCLKIEEKPVNQMRNKQSPIVGTPPEYVESKAEREPSETGTVKPDEECHGLNSTGWPLSDMSRLGPWLADAEGMETNSGRHDGTSEEPSNVGKSVQTNDATSEGHEVVKTVKDNKERELSKNDVKEQSPTSPKKSRLPPVCLRVDPLPKNKNGNGSSRSPSPPSSPKSTAAKESSRLDSMINSAIVEPNSEKIIKEVEAKMHESLDNHNQGDEEPLSSPTPPQENVWEKDGTISEASTEKDVDEGLEVSTRGLSDVEAALVIQSAYRGYDVRKWELLKKMKQLADVRQQVIEFRSRVKALELGPQAEKEKVFVGEMIMSLLLKLDAIQGLHPSVREFRKSLAKELVALQEKLDSMVTMEKHDDEETNDYLKEEEQHKDDDDVVAIGETAPEEANGSNGLLGEKDVEFVTYAEQKVDMEELPTRDNNNSNNFEADKLNHIDMGGEVSEAEKNAHNLEIEKQPEGHEDLNIQNELVTERSERHTEDEVGKVLENVEHQPMASSSKLYAAEEATPDGEPMPAKHNLGSEKEMDKKVIEENEKMRVMVEKLMEAGKEQIGIICKLSGRVKDLEKRLARRNKLRWVAACPKISYVQR